MCVCGGGVVCMVGECVCVCVWWGSVCVWWVRVCVGVEESVACVREGGGTYLMVTQASLVTCDLKSFS